MDKGPLKIAIQSIRLDGDTQSRDSVNQVIVNEYADDMREGAVFPPVIVFDDGNDMWLSEGFHRLYAARQTGQTEIEADVRKGTKRDAQRNSMQSNATHGARRTNADKRRAVAMAFRWLMEEGRSLEGITDTEVAGMAAVTRFVVSMMRKEIVSEVDTNRSKCNEPRINGVAPSVEIKRLQSELETSKRETHSVEQQLSAVQSDLRLVKRALEATPEVVERDKEFLRNKLKEEQERHDAERKELIAELNAAKAKVKQSAPEVVEKEVVKEVVPREMQEELEKLRRFQRDSRPQTLEAFLIKTRGNNECKITELCVELVEAASRGDATIPEIEAIEKFLNETVDDINQSLNTLAKLKKDIRSGATLKAAS